MGKLEEKKFIARAALRRKRKKVLQLSKATSAVLKNI